MNNSRCDRSDIAEVVYKVRLIAAKRKPEFYPLIRNTSVPVEVWMNSLAPRLRVTVLALSFCIVLVLGIGCSPNAESEIISPDLGNRLVLAQSAGEVVLAPTAVPPKLAELPEDQVMAGLPDDVMQALASATPANGETLALTFACIGCHSLDPNAVMAGPTWHNVGDTAVVRVPGESPAFYLYQSITAPNAHIAAGYPSNIMPQNFNETMSLQQIADMVAYLLAQNGQP